MVIKIINSAELNTVWQCQKKLIISVFALWLCYACSKIFIKEYNFCMSLVLFGMVSQVILAKHHEVYIIFHQSRLRSRKLFKACVYFVFACRIVKIFEFIRILTVEAFW